MRGVLNSSLCRLEATQGCREAPFAKSALGKRRQGWAERPHPGCAEDELHGRPAYARLRRSKLKIVPPTAPFQFNYLGNGAPRKKEQPRTGRIACATQCSRRPRVAAWEPDFGLRLADARDRRLLVEGAKWYRRPRLYESGARSEGLSAGCRGFHGRGSGRSVRGGSRLPWRARL